MYYDTIKSAKSIILSTGASLNHLTCHSNLPNTETCKHQSTFLTPIPVDIQFYTDN